MTHKNGFMSDLSSEAQSRRSKLARRDSDVQRAKAMKAKSPWRNGPALRTRNAYDAFAKIVAGDAHGLRSKK